MVEMAAVGQMLKQPQQPSQELLKVGQGASEIAPAAQSSAHCPHVVHRVLLMLFFPIIMRNLAGLLSRER